MEPRTIIEVVREGVHRIPVSVCFGTKRDGRWIPTAREEFLERARAASAALHGVGVGRGDRVAIHAENCTEWLIVDHAAHRLGAAVVPIYVTQPADQIRYIVEDSGARVYFISRRPLYDRVREVLAGISGLRVVSLVDELGEGIPGWEAFLASGRRLLEADPSAEAGFLPAVDPGDLASIVYTSGTTGVPKGVMLSHRNLASNVMASVERAPFEVPEDQERRVLSYLPLSHVFERMITYLHITLGCSVYFVENLDELLDDLAEIRPVHFASVPRLLEKMVIGLKVKASQAAGVRGRVLRWAITEAEGFDVEAKAESLRHRLADALVFGRIRRQFGGNLQGISCGGAALSAEVMSFINGIGIFCGQGYGMTETSPVVAVYQKDRLRAGSVGALLRDVELRVAEDGELLVRGPNVMMGYHNNPDQTREVLSEDGWLRTGDIGYQDEDGFLFITDRKKELLKLSTGKYVAPQPIETALSSTRLIEQAMVVGDGRQFCAALLVLNPDAVRAHCRERGLPAPEDPLSGSAIVREEVGEAVRVINRGLPPWEQLKHFALLDKPFTVENGELTPTLKLKRRPILTHRQAVVDRLYA